MYQYNTWDQKIVDERVAEFRDQVRRRLDGTLGEDEFRALRLMNGLYLQRHAYMLRVAIPYGLLSSTQVRMLAHLARRYDKGYGHITTRQNLQYNWPELADVPEMLAVWASVEMHAIQTSGNCVRNISADQFSGVAGDEIEDPRPWCELLRQYSTFHPEFSYLPRKFKIALSGRTRDAAATMAHDIGLRMVEGENGEIGFKVLVGGGLGRTPVIGKVIREFLPKKHILTYTEAILRVYNLHGNRKNKYKARIKILVRSLGIDAFREQVEQEWDRIKDGPGKVTQTELDRLASFFPAPHYDLLAGADRSHLAQAEDSEGKPTDFGRWLAHNVLEHKIPGYNVVMISLKAPNIAPGDVTDVQLEAIADMADAYSFGEVRTTHEQNMLLADVRNGDLVALWKALDAQGLAHPNHGTLTDMICCPGLDFCSLANAGSLDVAQQLNDRFDDMDYLWDLGEIKLKMSGCINACGHHHVGHIGILGINKRGEEWYQIMLGGSAEDDASLGRWIGPALPKAKVSDAVAALLDVYVAQRHEGERFLDTVRRLGLDPFHQRVYGDDARPQKKKHRKEPVDQTRSTDSAAVAG